MRKKTLIFFSSIIMVICLTSCSGKKTITIDVQKACPVREQGTSGVGRIWFDCSTENINKSNLDDYDITYVDSILNGLEFEVLPMNDYFAIGDEYEVNVVNAEEVYKDEDQNIAIQLVNTSYSGIIKSLVHDYLNVRDIPAEDIDALREIALERVKEKTRYHVRSKNNDYLLSEIMNIEPLGVYYVTSEDTNKLRTFEIHEYVNESGLNERILVYAYKVSFKARLLTEWDGTHPVYSDETYDDFMYVYCGFRDFTSRYIERKDDDINESITTVEANTNQEFEKKMLKGDTYTEYYGIDDYFVEKWVDNK